MAKGNNGNLLQHAVEVELAVALAGAEDTLSVLFTHGMAPTEPFEPRGKNPSACLMLERCLEHSADENQPVARLPAVVGAYRHVGATTRAYPNSARLLEAALGRERLRGNIFEVNHIKEEALGAAWANTEVKVFRQSWRSIDAETALQPLLSPWLISLDPMTFKADPRAADDDSLRESDLRLVASFAGPLMEKPGRGALAVFCYSMRPAAVSAFEDAIETALVAGLPCSPALCFVRTTARGGNAHVGALVSTDESLLERAAGAWDRIEDQFQP